jgi:hypothetical protein
MFFIDLNKLDGSVVREIRLATVRQFIRWVLKACLANSKTTIPFLLPLKRYYFAQIEQNNVLSKEL